jgi:mediator of RNA polymerase II transcription subunit 31
MEDVSDEERFFLDLEFLQLLSNAKYLQYLAQNGYFNDYRFMNYLRFLKATWSKPEYLQYIHFPQCMGFLDMILSSSAFRDSLKLPSFIEYIHQQQGSHWMVGPQPMSTTPEKVSGSSADMGETPSDVASYR